MNTNESNILKEMKKLINVLERRISKKMDIFENRVNHLDRKDV